MPNPYPSHQGALRPVSVPPYRHRQFLVSMKVVKWRAIAAYPSTPRQLERRDDEARCDGGDDWRSRGGDDGPWCSGHFTVEPP